MPGSIAVRRVAAAEAADCVDALADLLIDCVDGGASVSFMAPLARAEAVTFWRDIAQGVTRGERALLVAEDDAGRIVGTVQVVLAMPPNQPHRGDVVKLLVRRDARRRGVAARLMEAVDDVARAEGKTLLVLDTITGSDGDRVYRRAGWQHVGEIPDYALMPYGGLAPTTYFYKRV
jgi:GNAT superfamily N-acetyltransferase